MRTTKDIIDGLRQLKTWDRLTGSDYFNVMAAAARLEELDAEGWRSVEEEVPGPDVCCMVCDNKGVVHDTAFFSKDAGDVWFAGIYMNNITHWRPRPAPPKPGQSGGGE